MIAWNILAALLIVIFIEFAVAMSLITNTMNNYNDDYGTVALSVATLDARTIRYSEWVQSLLRDAITEKRSFLVPVSCYAFAREHNRNDVVDANVDFIDYGIAVTYQMKWGGPITKRIEYVLKTENVNNSSISYRKRQHYIRSAVLRALNDSAFCISKSFGMCRHIDPLIDSDKILHFRNDN